MPEYWAYTWLEGHEITTIEQLKVRLASPATLAELKQLAKSVIEGWVASSIEARPLSLIAGAGIDLSGRLDCNATECRRAQVDRLFRRAWHYFQTIVARDAIAEDLIVHGNCPDQEIRERLIPHFETALIVQDIGAKGLVEFLPRVPACSKHWRAHAKEAGIDDIADGEPEIVDQLLRETRINLDFGANGVSCTLNNPNFSHTQWVDIPRKLVRDKTKLQIKRAALEMVVQTFFAHLTADICAAKKYGGAFGSTIPMFSKFLANRGKKVGNVAFEVELPVLEGLTTAQLIEVRLKYEDTFSKFRKRISSFLEESMRLGVAQPTDIRAKFKAELIDGELEDLKSKLRQAEESLKRKSLYALCLGGLAATIGVTTGAIAPPAAYGLLATVTAASLSPGASKYVDDKLNLKADNMYFLLQAEAHQH